MFRLIKGVSDYQATSYPFSLKQPGWSSITVTARFWPLAALSEGLLLADFSLSAATALGRD